ncbi:MAG: hypothetical protein RQ729_13375, partial [Wenzhouxiangellaceae bacterium]|nr:hypothetical protein [Wenzhouxiangellaceae bacterium]
MTSSEPASDAAPDSDTDTDAADSFAGEPTRVVERDGVTYTLLGTAHVSQASVQAVHDHLACDEFDAVAVELCPSRHRAL